MLRNVFGHPSLTLYILQSVSSSAFGWQWGSGTRGTPRPTSTFSETLWCQASWFTSPHLRKDLFWWDVRVLLFQSQGNPRCGGTNHLSHHCMCICLCWVWDSVFSRVDWIWILYPLIPDNWSSPGIPLSKPHGPSSGHGNISSTSHHSKLMTDLNLDWHFECHFSWSDELVTCFHTMWCVLVEKRIFFYTVSR